MADEISNLEKQKALRIELKELNAEDAGTRTKSLADIIDLEDKLSDLSETIAEARAQQTKYNMAGEK